MAGTEDTEGDSESSTTVAGDSSDGSDESSDSTETETETGTSTESESSESESDSSTETGSETETDTETDSDTDTDTDTGEPPPPEGPCTMPTDAVQLAITGSMFVGDDVTMFDASSCDLPEHMQLAVGTEGYGLLGYGGCDPEADYDLSFDIDLPNNNWEPPYINGAFDYSCMDVYAFTEPDGDEGCRLARLDIVDPDAPTMPVFSAGSTSAHASANGLALEPVNPKQCESDCLEGGPADLRVAAGGSEVVIEAAGFPWTKLDVADSSVRVIRFDALSYAASEGEGCEPQAALDHVAWASFVSDIPAVPEGGTGGDDEDPGACLGEVDDPQPDTFVGDGVADMEMALWTVEAEPPSELTIGARIHVQGSYFDCCDDDIIVRESLVVRSYPSERFIVGLVDSWWKVPPEPGDSFFAEIGEDLDSWLHPFVLSAHDDLLCNKQWLDGNIMTPMRLYVDAGTCAPAKIPDERSGPFAELFFVAARDMDSWDPNGVYVDTISHGSVFISRQGCEGECPETADLFECPAAEPWPDDRVEMRFVGYAYEPSSDGYDHVCEILSVEDNAEQVTYVLDCGAL